MTVLFITHPYPNYVPDLLLHGLRKLLGPKVIDFPKKECLYNGVLGLGVCPEDQLCHGWFPADDGTIDRADVWDKVRNHFFEYVVADCRSIKVLTKHLTDWPERLVIIDGEDAPVSIKPGKFVVCRRETDGFDQSIPLPMAIPEEILEWITSYDGTDKEYSVGFMGSGDTGIRARIIEAISKHWPDSLLQNSTVPLAENPTPGGRLGRNDYYLNLQKCRIVLSLPGAGYDTFRFWENAACEGVHVSARMPLLIPNGFTERLHLFTFSSIDQLRVTVSQILENRIDTEGISKRARSHLRQFHTTKERAKYFLSKLKATFA